MARYNKQTWVDGVSPVNAERMNHMESGIASSVRTINGNSPDANGNINVSGGSSGGTNENTQSSEVVTTIEELTAKISAGAKVITLAADADIEVSGTITLKEGTILNGNGATVRRATGFEGRLFILMDGCRMENLTIEGNRTAMVSPHWDATNEIVVYANCVIDGVTINNANEAIVVYGDDVIVRGCRLYNCGGNGIHMSGADRTRIEDCVIIGANKNADVMENSNGCIYWCLDVNDAVVTGCYCEDGKAGFGGIDGVDNSHLKIIGCTAKNCTYAVRGEHYRDGDGGSIDVTISGNQFIECGPLLLVYGADNVIPGEGLVISGNLFTNTKISIDSFRKAVITGNTLNGGSIEPHRCPYAVISDNVIDNPTDWGIYSKNSPNINISGNSIRCLNYGATVNNCPGIVILGNTIRQSPHNKNNNCINLVSSPEAVVDCNKIYIYYGTGINTESNCKTTGNYIVAADSSLVAIRVYGGRENFIVAQNMTNGTFAVNSSTNCVNQNNITIESTAFVDATYTLTNITTDGFAKALTNDDFGFTLTAASGYTLPDSITVTMGGTALVAGKGYTYDKATGTVTVYRVSGAVEITAAA